MEINRHNYEAFLLDLMEGRLSAEDRQRLDDFLLLNPDCANELVDAESWVLESGKVEFRNRDRLKKTLPGPSTELEDHNFDLFSIARMEGDLTGKQEGAYQDLIEADPNRYKEWTEWQQTRLAAPRIIYKGKAALKRKNHLRNRMIWMSIVSSAAAIALLVVLFRSGQDLRPAGQAGTLSNSSIPQADNTPELTEARPGPEQTEVRPGPEQTEARPGPELTEARSGPEQTEARPNPELTAVRPGPELTEARKTPDEPVNDQYIQGMNEEPVREYTDPVALASVRRLNEFSPAGDPVPDEIEALEVQVVPVHLSSLSVAQLSDMDLREFVDNYAEEKNFSLWTIANAGINGINKLAGSDISLLSARDESGEISGFQLKGKRFSVTRPVGQDE